MGLLTFNSLRKVSILSITIFSFSLNASINSSSIKEALLQKYSLNYENKNQIAQLKNETLNYGAKSVEALMEVMKNGKYPDKNRWVATFLLGQIVGDKSAPFLAKFFKHPNWVLRMASLKTMLALKQKNYGRGYSALLSDNSFIVRNQALENIRLLNISSSAPEVWAMLYDKKNYYQPKLKGKELKIKRSNIIKSVITTIGDLKFAEARGPLLKMIQKDRYNDIFNEMDQSLSKITGEKSPKGELKTKRLFWSKVAMNTVIN